MKKSWAKLEQVFKVKFLNTKKATKIAPELERKRYIVLYTHIIFTEKVIDLVKRVNIEVLTSGLWNVQAARDPERENTRDSA